MSELAAELTRRAERHEEEAARSARYQASHTYLDPLTDEAGSANAAAAKAYREAVELAARTG